MRTIDLNTLILGAVGLTEAGNSFYCQIADAFDNADKVIVNMENVLSLPSVFLNVSIGKIIEKYGSVRLKSDMSFTKITKSQAIRLQEYLAKF